VKRTRVEAPIWPRQRRRTGRVEGLNAREPKHDEPCARWRERDGHTEAALLHQQLVAWAAHDVVIEQLRQARPTLPSLHDDRKAEVVEPLIAIADVAGGQWPTLARKAVLALAGTAEDTDIVVELLKDPQTVLMIDTINSVIPTKDLIAKLTAAEDRPWATWRGTPAAPR
jgi:Protein of unknown function (DUF3631)